MFPPALFSSRMAELTSSFNPSNDLADLTEKVAIVTGGNKGIGYWTIVHLRRRGAKVYMCTRDEARAKAAIESINALPNPKGSKVGEVVFLQMDLENPRGVHNAALSILEKETRLDIVVNNAALAMDAYQETKEGVSRHMVINHISHHLLIKTLSPLLEATAREPDSDVRIVTVTSTAHLFAQGPDIKFDSLEAFNTKFPDNSEFVTGMALYGHSKLANVLMSKELQRRYDADNIPITCITVHPGYMSTDLTNDLFSSLRPAFLARIFLKLVCIVPEKGSYTILFAAASPTVKANPSKFKGSYLMPFDKISETSAEGNDPALAKTLWETTEKVLNEQYEL